MNRCKPMVFVPGPRDRIVEPEQAAPPGSFRPLPVSQMRPTFRRLADHALLDVLAAASAATFTPPAVSRVDALQSRCQPDRCPLSRSSLNCASMERAGPHSQVDRVAAFPLEFRDCQRANDVSG